MNMRRRRGWKNKKWTWEDVDDDNDNDNIIGIKKVFWDFPVKLIVVPTEWIIHAIIPPCAYGKLW